MGEQQAEKEKTLGRKAATVAKNKYRNNNYDRIELAVPKGMKKCIEEIARQQGFPSKNAYIIEAIKEKYKRESGKDMEWKKEE